MVCRKLIILATRAPRRRDAYLAEGLALEYYESWDAIWKRPWDYFDTVASVNKSLIMSCSLGFPSGQMKYYLDQSGDTQGVTVDASGTYSAVCVDDAFWIAPVCRGNHSQCVVMLTGGGGWGVNEMMQKSTALNMPFAIAVAVSWTAYTELPLVKRMVFYWFTPDPTFLDLAPLTLLFPAHDSLAFSRGDFVTQGAAFDIRTLVSRDLGRLAPKVELFLSNMRLDLETVNAILLENKNLAEGMNETVCRRIQKNTAEWETWIPDDTKCFPGFGLFDDVKGDYVLDRQVADDKRRVNQKGLRNDVSSNALHENVLHLRYGMWIRARICHDLWCFIFRLILRRCLACPSGKFSAPLIDTMGSTFVCEVCPYGTSQPSGGQQQCEPCGQGEYQDTTGQFACKRCPVGFYEERVSDRCSESTVPAGR